MSGGNKKLLCVDDAPKVLKSLGKILSKYFDVETARNGPEALEVFGQAGPFPVVLVDYSMPGMNGVELVRELRKLYPRTQAILLTSHSDPDIVLTAMNEDGIFKYLMKPAAIQKLIEVIQEAFETVGE